MRLIVGPDAPTSGRSRWNDAISKLLPGEANGRIFRVVRDSSAALGPWALGAVERAELDRALRYALDIRY